MLVGLREFAWHYQMAGSDDAHNLGMSSVVWVSKVYAQIAPTQYWTDGLGRTIRRCWQPQRRKSTYPRMTKIDASQNGVHDFA